MQVIDAIKKYALIWTAIGGLIAVIGSQGGAVVPEWMLTLFSQSFVDAVLVVVGAVVALLNLFKAGEAAVIKASGVSPLSENAKAWPHLLNPFKSL